MLRHMPKRRKLAKMPIVGKLLEEAMKAKFLWSSHIDEVRPAFLVGWVVTLSPLFGIHTFLALFGVILFRANLIIPLALQFVSTPLTIPFLWPALHKIGRWLVDFFAVNSASVNTLAGHYLGGKLARTTAETALGGIAAAFICAIISMVIYSTFFSGDSTKNE
jgi:uncharacterized protein (DUF2062 family)